MPDTAKPKACLPVTVLPSSLRPRRAQSEVKNGVALAAVQLDQFRQRKLTVGFLLPNNFTFNALALFVDALRLAGDERNFSRRVYSDWSIIGDAAQLIRSSCGISTGSHLADAVTFLG